MAEKFPSWKQALITFFGGIVLAGTSCFGFVLSLGNNFEHGGDNVFTPLTAILFCASLLAILVGFVFILMRLIRGMTEKGPQPPVGMPPPPPPGGPPEPGVPS